MKDLLETIFDGECGGALKLFIGLSILVGVLFIGIKSMQGGSIAQNIEINKIQLEANKHCMDAGGIMTDVSGQMTCIWSKQSAQPEAK